MAARAFSGDRAGPSLGFGDSLNLRGWDFRSLGQGGVNFEEIIRQLNYNGYDGLLSTEREDSGMDREAGAKEACGFTKRLDFVPWVRAFDAASSASLLGWEAWII